jgi:hypothetical protein
MLLCYSYSPMPILPPVDKDGEICPKPQTILQRGMKKHGNKAVTEVLVQWQGTQEEDAT